MAARAEDPHQDQRPTGLRDPDPEGEVRRRRGPTRLRQLPTGGVAMSEVEPPQLDVVQMLVEVQFSGAAATLRVLRKVADRERARKIHAELTRICSELEQDHSFRNRKKEEKKR
jgi:hypothetical protein